MIFERPKREAAEKQAALFDVEPDWRDSWWGMPDFAVEDCRPLRTIAVNFATRDDVAEFCDRLDISVSHRTDSIWFPTQEKLRGEFEYVGEPTDSKYPICIPSKGRARNQKTAKALSRMGVAYRIFVEEKEAYDYRGYHRDNVVVMPFSDLGEGSIPARNFIWDWARDHGYARHWVVDDNIVSFARTHKNRRLCVRGGGFFRAMEDFVDRYENVALAGPHDKAFVMDRDPNLTPFLLNSRIYSCILIDTSLDYRWRGRYNEDTDLSLRILKGGYVTVLFRALCMDKGATYYGDGNKNGALRGGNTDNVYNGNDYRRAFAESLREQHPDVVSVVWKFNRWHHQVDYSPFKNNKLRLRPDVTPIRVNNEYGMELVRVKGK